MTNKSNNNICIVCNKRIRFWHKTARDIDNRYHYDCWNSWEGQRLVRELRIGNNKCPHCGASPDHISEEIDSLGPYTIPTYTCDQCFKLFYL